jgi:hypothetical protein
MNSRLLIVFVLIFACAELGTRAAEQPANHSEYVDYMFVFGAKSGSVEGDTLTLNGVPNVVYFSGRPYRMAGHMDADTFVKVWSDGKDGIDEDPPNAVLSMMADHGAFNVVVELLSVKAEGDAVSFKIRKLDGEVQREFGEAALFVDSL